MPRRNKFIVAALLLLFIMTGFFREFVFLNINEASRVVYYQSPDPHVAPVMKWMLDLSYPTLYYLKWPLTLLFSAWFALYSVLCVRYIFGDRKYEKITWIAYAGVFTLSLLFFVAGWLINDREATYAIARFLSGIIETPAMLVILVASFLLMRTGEGSSSQRS